MMKSSLMRIYLVFIFLFLYVPNLVSAEAKTFIKEYTYQASEYDSKVTCRTLALEQVKRLLLEEVGTYLESQTEVKNFRLSKDQITVLTAGVVKTEILKEAWDGKAYWFTAKIVVDTESAIKALNELRSDRERTRELEETRKRADDALMEIEKLNKKLEIAKSDQEAKKKYDKSIEILNAKEWFEKGEQLYNSAKYKEAIDASTKAIEIDPKYTLAYLLRGVSCVHTEKQDMTKCLEDINKAISFDPNNERSYRYRGIAYGHYLGNDEQAIKDLSKCIELDATSKRCFFFRALSYARLSQYDKALQDYNRAIEIDPIYTKALEKRGSLYADVLKDYEHGLKDFDLLVRSHQNNPRYYAARGICYIRLNKYREAIDDFNHSIELDPQNARAYDSLGDCYYDLKEYLKAISYYTKAIALNPKWAEAYIGRGNSYRSIAKDDKALADFNQAVMLEPLKARYYDERGDFYYSKCFDFKQSVKKAQNKKSILLKNKWCSAALEDYGKSIQLDTKMVSAYESLHNLYRFILDDIEMACHYLVSACPFVSESTPLYYNCQGVKDIGIDFCKGKWRFIGEDFEDGRWYFEDRNRYNRPRDNVKSWVRIVYPISEKSDENKESEFKMLCEINCSKKTMRTISSQSIKRNGNVENSDLLSQWSQIQPGSLYDKLMSNVCDK